jgi:hypothetical protein
MKLKLFAASLMALAIAAPMSANAASQKIACHVSVSYGINGNVQETYTKDFSVAPGADFSQDFSTNLRTKDFFASTANNVVTIRYFNDVGTFDTVDFTTNLTLQEGRGTVSGAHNFDTTVGSSGRHTTNYDLSCKRL